MRVYVDGIRRADLACAEYPLSMTIEVSLQGLTSGTHELSLWISGASGKELNACQDQRV